LADSEARKQQPGKTSGFRIIHQITKQSFKLSSDCHYLNKAGHQPQFDTMLLNKLIFVIRTQLHQIGPNAMKNKKEKTCSDISAV
jgi:hypothetical protein